MDLMQCLRTGRINAVTRAELVNRTGMPDRANRREIERLRREGVPVISASDGRGYWLAESVEEVERFLREADLRAEAQRYPKLRQYAAAAKGLRVVPVRAHVRRVGAKEIEGQVRF